jgi:WD40 repeat protein
MTSYSPIESIKQMDIHSVCATHEHLFMGCLDHSIIPIKAQSPFSACTSIVNSHLDTVTALASLSNYPILVSASKDKYLRAWQLPDAG